jgi:predicted ATPase
MSLLLMSHAILATAERPLLVIDEPELSLGIEWQRDLLPELLRCTASAEVQFLIASHSLQVMNAVPRQDIILPSES